MDAYLFEHAPLPVQILPEAVAMGGSWEGNVGRLVLLAWESHLLRRVYDFLLPLDAPIMIDVGANTGSYALLAALLPNLYVESYEPNAAAFDLLQRHVKLNHLPNVMTYPFALSDHVGEALLSLSSAEASGCATLGKPIRFNVVEQQTVQLVTLDMCVTDDFDHIDFLKIDTEGAEKFVLQGARETIMRYKPTMLIECQPMNTAAFGYEVAETMALVESYGYSVEWCSAEDIWATAR